jgi:hypothetical protein
MAKRNDERRRELREYAEAKRREADEIFARVNARIEARKRAEEERRERRRRLLRFLTFGRAA